jgi:alkaline phosphatase
MQLRNKKSELKKIIFILTLLVPSLLHGQKNAHSHNDYLQKKPFSLAYNLGFGSMEADIFLVNDTLFVAHERQEILKHNTLQRLYLDSLKHYFNKNQGSIFKDKNQGLQLLIDLKTGGNTLQMLQNTLQDYKDIFYPRGNVKIVISGSVPDPSQFNEYADFMFFDGRPEIQYTSKQLEKVALISQSFKRFSLWNGHDLPTPQDETAIKNVIQAAHALNKPFRFWANPDVENAWKVLVSYGVDYINTDNLIELSRFLTSER